MQELKNYRNEKKLKAKAELFAKRAKQISNKQAQDDNRIQVRDKAGFNLLHKNHQMIGLIFFANFLL